MKSKHALAFGIAAALALPVIVAGCRSQEGDAGADKAAAATLVPATGQTEPTASGQTNAAILVRDAADPARAQLIATAALGGLETYGVDGKRVATTPAGEVAALDIASGVRLGGGRVADVVAAVDTTGNFLRLFQKTGEGLVEVADRVAVGRSRRGPRAGPPQVVDRLVPHVALEGVVREPVDVLLQAVGVDRLHHRQDPRMEGPLALGQARVGHLAREGVLEGVLELGRRARLVEELGALELAQGLADRLLRHRRAT